MQNLLLFDIDGTIIRGKNPHIQSFEHALMTVHDLTISIDAVEIAGSTDRLVLEHILNAHGISDHKIEECFECMTLFFTKAISESAIEILPGVIDILEILCRNESVIIGHVTGNVKKIADAKMRKVGLHAYFMVGGYGCSEHSARYELVHTASDMAQKIFSFDKKKDKIFVIGDTPRDVEAGKNAGAITIAVATGHHTIDELNTYEPDLLVNNLEEGRRAILNLLE